MQDVIITMHDSNEKKTTKTFQKIPPSVSDTSLIMFCNAYKDLTTSVDTAADKRVTSALNLEG